MNNPLEAVTQAVNSLVTALKLPDESAKANEVLSLVKDGATDGVQIDPTLFSQYGIRTVPALVVFCSQGYDIIRGNLRVGQALEKVAATGDCRQVAHDLLAGKGDSGK